MMSLGWSAGTGGATAAAAASSDSSAVASRTDGAIGGRETSIISTDADSGMLLAAGSASESCVPTNEL
jgi:hypothetical protein